jgi:hypothetical protein
MTTIRFEAIEPDFEARGTGLYRAAIDHRPVKAGITNEAWIHLIPATARMRGNEISDLGHPAHRMAQVLIQKKYDREGLDRAGAVIVTLADVLDDMDHGTES